MRTVSIQTSARGVSAVETVIGVSLIAVVLLFSMSAVAQFVSFGRDQVEKTRALYLAQGTLEATRLIRDGSWGTFSGLTLNTTYYVAYSSTTVSATTVPQVFDGLTPRFKVMSVYRASANSDIVASTSGVGKSVDPFTKHIEATVPYGTDGAVITLSQYLADIAP